MNRSIIKQHDNNKVNYGYLHLLSSPLTSQILILFLPLLLSTELELNYVNFSINFSFNNPILPWNILHSNITEHATIKGNISLVSHSK